jgi:hypothetical protein
MRDQVLSDRMDAWHCTQGQVALSTKLLLFVHFFSPPSRSLHPSIVCGQRCGVLVSLGVHLIVLYLIELRFFLSIILNFNPIAELTRKNR